MDRKHAELVAVPGRPLSSVDIEERAVEARDEGRHPARPYAPAEEGAMMETSCPNCTCS
jgi:hypothetical protein